MRETWCSLVPRARRELHHARWVQRQGVLASETQQFRLKGRLDRGSYLTARRCASKLAGKTIDVEVVGGETETRDETDGGEVDDDSDEQLDEVTRLGEDVEKYRLEDDFRSVRRMVDPRLPSVKDVEDHELQGHLLCRNWCSVCVRAKRKDLDHRSDPLKERSVPEHSFDFAFPGDEFRHKTAVLVGKGRTSGLVLAAAFLVKGL